MVGSGTNMKVHTCHCVNQIQIILSASKAALSSNQPLYLTSITIIILEHCKMMVESGTNMKVHTCHCVNQIQIILSASKAALSSNQPLYLTMYYDYYSSALQNDELKEIMKI
jgi:hypothetical protein